MSLFYIYPGVKLNLFFLVSEVAGAIYAGSPYIHPGVKLNLLAMGRLPALPDCTGKSCHAWLLFRGP